jgi:DNA-binding NarL/FixJ family response regulator
MPRVMGTRSQLLTALRAVLGGSGDRATRRSARELFLSSRTVGSHLRKVLTKLGISSRREPSTPCPTSTALALRA